jgi:hypothetical protein
MKLLNNRTWLHVLAAAILMPSMIANAQSSPGPEIEEQRQLRPSWSGSWFNENQSGHGITVEVLTDGRAVVHWMTYDEDGNQLWLFAVSDEIDEIALTGLFIPNIRIQATAYYTDGMRFGSFNPDDVNLTEWGQITLTFPYFWCGSYSGLAWAPIVPGFSSGEVEIQRLTEIIECKENGFIYGGVWDVQLEFDGPKTAVEVEVVENEDDADSLLYEFTDPDNCIWTGEILSGWGLVGTRGEKNCPGSTENYDVAGKEFVEHKLCVENECTRLDQMLIFKEESTHLIFTR